MVFKKDDSPKENVISNKVILHSLKYSGTKAYLMNSYELNKLYKQINPDIVNAHYASGYGTLARFSELRPLILSVWGSDVYDFPYQNKLKMRIIKDNLLYADEIASTSNCMAKQVKKLLNLDSVNITVTPFGVDTKKFLRKNEKRKRDNICIGNIKTLTPKYGISDLIKSIRILKDKLKDDNLGDISNTIKLIIYGDGEQKEELVEMVKKYDLNDTVEFKDKIPNSEVPNALENFDIFCATSISESFGVSAVEAMAMELPVVATDVDGFKEVVDDGVTGIIVKRQKPVEIATALKKLVLDEGMRLDMGKKGRKRVLRLYDWEKNVDIMEKLYNNVYISRKR